MPRRYPRLQAKDKHGNIVGIPLTIAPRLYPNEEFVSLPQEKVNAIAEANERVRTQEADITHSPKPSPTPDNETAYKAGDDEVSLHENVGSSITGTVSPGSSASSSQHPVRDVSSDKPKRGKKRVRRLWTPEEDDIVLCAVSRNETGPSLIGRLPNRSRSAVLKRFYILREKWKNDRRGRGRDGGFNSASEVETGEKIGESSNVGAGDNDGDTMKEGKNDTSPNEVESDNALEDDDDHANVEDGKIDDGAESLDEYESYDENEDGEVDDGIDEDGGEKVTSYVEDGYRPDEEMDEILPLE